jgi:aspartyl-tRNA(Asn)/glutamyl-tRNA(Gln) amidotransferase subunit A
LYASLHEIRASISRSELSCAQLVEQYLQRIEANQHLNIFLEVFADEARRKAIEIDQKIANGTAGRLAGMVIGLKDVLCYADHKVLASSKILGDFRSQFTATAVQRLLDEDAIIIGRQNCDEFAMGSSSENSAFGPVRNPHDPQRVSGGSSGGSAASVAAGMCTASLGSDTGGSVRQPAAFCGVYGLKPNYARVSRHGLIAYGSSFDCIGTMTNSVEDAALLLEIMAGADDFDSTISFREVPKFSDLLQINYKPRVAYIRETVENSALQPEIQAEIMRKIEALRAEGCTVEAVDFPLLEHILPVYYILTTAEASTNLSRYDGARYGYRSPKAVDVMSMYKKSRSEGFGEEVKRRIILGTFVLSSSYYDAFFTKAQKVRRLIQEKTLAILSNYDFILSPTTPTTAFRLGEFSSDPMQMYLADIFSVQANLAGIPAMSFPSGKDEKGMPIGLQLMCRPFAEADMLAFTKYLENL